MTKTTGRIAVALVLIAVALLSFFWWAPAAADPQNHIKTIASLDEKITQVTTLNASALLASAGVSFIPGDGATPIAEKLADLSQYFLLILCSLYTEKYLMTILGMVCFRILLPAGLVLGAVSLFVCRPGWRGIALKLALTGTLLYVAIPGSLRLADMVYDTYAASLDTTITESEQIAEDTGMLSEAEGNKGLLAGILDSLQETASSLTSKAAALFQRFLEAAAILIVTACIIPILGLVLIFWGIRLLTGANLPPLLPPGRRFGKDRSGRTEEERETVHM